MTAHTPTPWNMRTSDGSRGTIEDANGNDVAHTQMRASMGKPDPERQANGEFIVTACNAHDDLVRRACDVLEGLEGMALSGAMSARVEKLRAALAAAGVK